VQLECSAFDLSRFFFEFGEVYDSREGLRFECSAERLSTVFLHSVKCARQTKGVSLNWLEKHCGSATLRLFSARQRQPTKPACQEFSLISVDRVPGDLQAICQLALF
jgi:hypothetical protein